MRGSGEGLASTDTGESGVSQHGQTVLPFPQGDQETRAETALAVPDTDPERIAYNLWREGKVDEAIAFLEREITTERSRRRETALVAAAGSDVVSVEPASDWRERHKAALSDKDFNAFGASAQTIDITPTPADAIVAHARGRSVRPAWLVALLVLAGIGAALATNLWDTRERIYELAALPMLASEPTADAEQAPATQAADVEPTPAEPETEVAAIGPDPDAVDVPPPETEVAEIPPPDSATIEELPPPPPGAAPIEASEPVESEGASAPVPPEEAFGQTSSKPPDEEELSGPETTASVESMPIDAESAPVVEPRLPRVRPEPSPEVVAAANAAPEPEPLVIPEPEIPMILGEPETTLGEIPDSVPVYRPGQVRIFGPIRRLAGAPRPLPLDDPSFQRTLTPAEYQALLERRAWAQHYAAQRRAGGASPRIITLP